MESGIGYKRQRETWPRYVPVRKNPDALSEQLKGFLPGDARHSHQAERQGLRNHPLTGSNDRCSAAPVQRR